MNGVLWGECGVRTEDGNGGRCKEGDDPPYGTMEEDEPQSTPVFLCSR